MRLHMFVVLISCGRSACMCSCSAVGCTYYIMYYRDTCVSKLSQFMILGGHVWTSMKCYVSHRLYIFAICRLDLSEFHYIFGCNRKYFVSINAYVMYCCDCCFRCQPIFLNGNAWTSMHCYVSHTINSFDISRLNFFDSHFWIDWHQPSLTHVLVRKLMCSISIHHSEEVKLMKCVVFIEIHRFDRCWSILCIFWCFLLNLIGFHWSSCQHTAWASGSGGPAGPASGASPGNWQNPRETKKN